MRRNKSGKKVHYRSFWLLGLLMVALLGVTSIFAVYTTNYVAQSMEENLAITLTSNAKGKTEAINLWLTTIDNETLRFVDKDMIRLYCAESILKAQGNDTSNHLGQMESMQDDDGNLKNIRDIITQQLMDFIETTSFTAGGIWDANLKSMLFTNGLEENLSAEQKKLVEDTLNSGKISFSNVHDGLAGLMITTVYPIFPPEYTELPKDKAVAALLLEIPLETPISKIFRSAEDVEHEVLPYRLFQWTTENNSLQFIDLSTGKLLTFEEWKTPKNETLPIMKRILPNGDFVYSLGIPLAGHNLLVSSEEPAHIAEDFYANFRNFMIVFVVGAIVVTGLLLWACWWFFVGRYERKVEASMRKLNEDVNTQQQIIDSINSTLTDGVVFTDTLGNIQYSNESFAKMVYHENSDDIVGFKMGSILNPDAAEMLQNHLDRVIRSEKNHDFEEKLTIQGKDVYWQAIYSPYFGDHDHVSGVVAVYRDTTKMVEEREAEQARIEQLIQVLTMSVGLVNPYLRGHSMHMGELAENIAKLMECTKEEQKTIGMAAALSQMGMISLPKEIINKKGALTDEEREIMKTHVSKTCDMLADFDFGLPVQETILQMNENMDGSGYPRKLKGDQISMLARILHIANSFCAILRPRVYRQARSLGDTIAILDKEQNIYDTEVLKMLKVFVISPEGKVFVNKLQRKHTK